MEQNSGERPLQLLVLEDSPEDAELLLATLRRGGVSFQADLVTCEPEIAAKDGKRYDLVLSDFRLKGWTGLEAFRFLQERGNSVPFILVTGSMGEEMAVECLKQGMADFVLKDRMERLPHAIERALAEAAGQRKRIEAEQALRRAQEELEQKVSERTAELSATNETLRQEIEQRRQAERAMRESEHRIGLLTEAIPDIVWTARADGAVDYCNQRWFSYSGLSLEDSLGRGWHRALHPDDVDTARERWRYSVQGRETFECEYRLRRGRDGEYRWHLARAVPLRGAGGEVLKWFGTCTDIHDRKLAHEAQLQLAGMRDDLVSHVSHALRTPLASMRGFSELLLSRRFSEEKQREFLGVIHKESNRLTELINEFLDLQRMEAGCQTFHFQKVDLAALIQERAAFFGTPDSLHQIRLELSLPLPEISADPKRVCEVLNNLISNALKYSPRGGEILVGARAEEGGVILWVADHGIGIPAQAMPHLFNKFYRIEHPDRQLIAGTGLGLASVKQIAQIHRGRVWAESIPGEGSTFFVYLPCPEFSATAAPSSETQPDAPFAPVLLVEDDIAFARLLREHIEAQGSEVRHTIYGEQALEWCRSQPPRIVLLDLHLAGAMDGWDLLLELKHDHRLENIPVVVMAGSDPNLHGLALGGADYALKTASPKVLRLAMLRQLPTLRGKRVLIADDDAVFRRRVAHLLHGEGARVDEAQDGEQALQRVGAHMPDLLILDLLMPKFDGFEVLRRLRSDRRAVNLRILVVTVKDLHLGEKAYLTRKMASLVGKDDARLDFITEVVTRALSPEPTLAVAAR